MSNVVAAFSAAQVAKLTGLSETQLRDWDLSGFFVPSMAAKNRRSPFSRIYSFDDVVGLRILGILRSEHKVGLVHLKDVSKKLSAHTIKPWSQLTLYVLNREVHFKVPETGDIRGAVSGQYAAPIPLSSVADDMREKADALRRRSKDQLGKIDQHRYVAHNAKVLAGTRIPVETIRAFFDAGYSTKDILKEYPTLNSADIHAALAESEGLSDVA